MVKRSQPAPQAPAAARIRRSYFECRYGQLHVHHAIPSGGGFEERPPLLALHEAGRTGRMFSALLTVLGADRSAFAPDLPGFGQSDGPHEALTAADHAVALGNFLDDMRLRQLDVLGCGLGSFVATELALSRPGVRRLVLLAPPSQAEQAAYPPDTQMRRIAQPVLLLYPRDRPQALVAAGNVPGCTRRELPGDLSLLETAPGTVADPIKAFLG